MKTKNQTFLAAIGDSNNPKTWSGIPYFFLQDAKKQSLIDEGLNLNADTFFHKITRLLWNSFRFVFNRETGGYQYSNFFLTCLWFPHLKKIKGGKIINCFQLYPKFILNRNTEELYFFIDQSLKQLFEQYEINNLIGKKIIKESLKLEKSGYLKAKKIIVHSNWCKSSLVNDYGIPNEKIFIIQPGANLYSDLYYNWSNTFIFNNLNVDNLTPLKLIFIGKEPIRKGLDRLLLAVNEAQKMGALINIRIIGCNKEDVLLNDDDLPKSIEWLGFVDKSNKAMEYFNYISECDIGCLLSKAEAGGICLREFHALGLAVMYSEVGGSPEHVIEDASIAIPLWMSGKDIGKILYYYFKNRDELNKLKSISFIESKKMLWSTTVEKIKLII